MNIRKLLFIGISLLAIFSSCNKKQDTILNYVDPFIGTGGHGHTFPGATLPFGMVQLSPDTRLTGWDGCSGYHYSDSIIYGFSHTHLSGTGVADYCDILFMPLTGEPKFISGYKSENEKTNEGYGSIFKKETEKASPNYYSVMLEDYNIKAELTASLRCGMQKYTFPKNDNSNIILDLTHRDEVLNSDIEILSNTVIQGSRISKSWATKQYIYFYAEFSKPFEKAEILKDDKILTDAKSAEGKNIKAFFNFKTKKDEEITVKVGISAVSKEGARRNYMDEIHGKSFAEIKQAGEKVWADELNRIEVKTDNDKDKTIFYTALYHSMIAPNLFQDTDGKYRGTDLQVHQNREYANYTIFSLWDTYRATHPLFTIIQQKRTNDFIKTFLTQYKEGGQLPVWELAGNYTGCMIGYHAVPVIADAMLKKIDKYDKKLAYEAMVHSAEMNRLGLKEYREYGYIPSNYEHESVSKTLEYAYDDWCIAQTAKLLGKDEDYVKYLKRSQYYKNIFNPETGFMTAKRDARWLTPFDPAEVNFNFTEANSWQYSFYVPHDISGLSKLHGGKEKLHDKLDELFAASTKTTGRGQVDITGLIGQYAHGNEPSHHMAYLYNFTGTPHKTQRMVNSICNEMYSDQPDGLIGNEDCGQMSAWYVFSAIGFYPVTPGSDKYIIGTPRFDKVRIKLENGNTFVVKAKNRSDRNIYVKSVELNGDKYQKSYITHEDIMDGAILEFTMSKYPTGGWAIRNEHCPETSINENLITPVPFVNVENTVFEDQTTIKVGSVDTTSKIYYTFGNEKPSENSNLYSSPFTIDSSVVINFVAINENGKSKTISTKFTKVSNKKKITLHTPYGQQYSAGGDNALIDGIKGVNDFRLGDWQGYQEYNLDAVIDMEEVTKIKEISIRFLQDINAWIFMPEQVDFFISKDNKTFTPVGTVKTQTAQDDNEVKIEEFKVKINPREARYIRVLCENPAVCPKGHKAEGYKAWIFADEITIN